MLYSRQSKDQQTKFSFGVEMDRAPLRRRFYKFSFFFLKQNTNGTSNKILMPSLLFHVAQNKYLPIDSILIKFFDVRDGNGHKAVSVYINAIKLHTFLLEARFSEDDEHFLGNKGGFAGHFECTNQQINDPALMIKFKNFMMFTGSSTDSQNICEKKGKIMSSSFSTNAVIFRCEGENIYETDVKPKTQCELAEKLDQQKKQEAAFQTDTTTTATAETTPATTDTTPATTTDSTTTDTSTTPATRMGRVLSQTPFPKLEEISLSRVLVEEDTTTATTGPVFPENGAASLLAVSLINPNYDSSQEIPASLALKSNITQKSPNRDLNCNSNCISCFKSRCFRCKLGFELVSLSYCQKFDDMIFNVLTKEYEAHSGDEAYLGPRSLLFPVREENLAGAVLLLNFKIDFQNNYQYSPIRFYLDGKHVKTVINLPQVKFV